MNKQAYWLLLIVSLSFLVVMLALYIDATSELTDFINVSGWTLFVILFLSPLVNSPKYFTGFFSLSSEKWLLVHIVLVFVGVLVFLIHVDFSLSTGIFETILYVCYLGTFFSGVLGLILNKTVPISLTRRGEEVIFERIPIYRKKIQTKVEALILESISSTNSSTIADFYEKELKTFFHTRYFWTHVLESRQPRYQTITKIESIQRYLNDAEKDYSEQLIDLVRKKDDLDYHATLQLILKLWPFVHVPFALMTVLLTFVHVIVVYAFTGGF